MAAAGLCMQGRDLTSQANAAIATSEGLRPVAFKLCTLLLPGTSVGLVAWLVQWCLLQSQNACNRECLPLEHEKQKFQNVRLAEASTNRSVSDLPDVAPLHGPSPRNKLHSRDHFGHTFRRDPNRSSLLCQILAVLAPGRESSSCRLESKTQRPPGLASCFLAGSEHQTVDPRAPCRRIRSASRRKAM